MSDRIGIDEMVAAIKRETNTRPATEHQVSEDIDATLERLDFDPEAVAAVSAKLADEYEQGWIRELQAGRQPVAAINFRSVFRAGFVEGLCVARRVSRARANGGGVCA